MFLYRKRILVNELSYDQVFSILLFIGIIKILTKYLEGAILMRDLWNLREKRHETLEFPEISITATRSFFIHINFVTNSFI